MGLQGVHKWKEVENHWPRTFKYNQKMFIFSNTFRKCFGSPVEFLSLKKIKK